MDRSIDSIGSCSLDADSTDFSDTSESLNFISPSATREDFTAGITERCRKIQQPSPLTPKLILNQPVNHTTTYFDINSGKISTIVSRAGETNGGRYFNGMSTERFLSTKTIELQSPTVVAHANKKPSYLNLACCVNGYSNYTNYDSIERKEINKSREVSPIRPIISSISMSRQQRSNENLLSVPQPVTFVKQSPLTSITKRFAALNLHEKDTVDNASLMTNGSSGSNVANRKSFIQQRVEKLYGTTKILTTMKSSDSIQLNGNGTITHINGSRNGSNGTIVDEKENDEESMNSLPVMKHLRPEFCRQLQFMSSPKKTLTRTSTGNILLKSEQRKSVEIKNDIISPVKDLKSNENIVSSGNTDLITSKSPINSKDVSKDQSNLELVNEEAISLLNKIKEIKVPVVQSEDKVSNNDLNMQKHETKVINKMESDVKTPQQEEKDGHYFLKLLNNEKSRILDLAEVAEKELLQLQSNPSTTPTEEIVGLVLAAIGKARLLATKKFKQFEGLCQENLKPNSDGPQTLSGDLQGFWDMMMLQVDNIDDAFKEIEKCRENGWKKPELPTPQPPKGSRLTKRPLTQAQSARTKSNVPIKKPSTTTGVSEAAQKREEQRKKLLEMKKRQKALIQNDTDENTISVELVGDVSLNGDSKKSNGNVEIIL